MKHPLLAVAVCYTGGILAGGLPVPLAPLFGFTLALAILLWFWPCKSPLLLGTLVFLTGWLNIAQRTAVLSPHDLRLLPETQTLAAVRGILRETPHYRVHRERNREEWSSIAVVEVESLKLPGQDWRPATGQVVSNTRGILKAFAGDRVEVEAVLEPAAGPLAEGLFDYRFYLRQQGIYHQLRVQNADDWRVTPAPSGPPLADRFCAWARKALAMGLPAEDETLRLEWALTLGWKEALTDESSEPFIRAATYHIFAVDGLRIAIISGILLGLLRVLGVPRVQAGLIIVPVICFYAALTGWPASAIRAMVMLMVVIAGWLLKRPADLLNSLYAAALIILVWEPRQIYLAGFQLSFFVVLCIILILPPMNQRIKSWFKPDPDLPESLEPRWKRMLRVPTLFVADLFASSVVAWLSAIPLVAYYFHIVTPVSGPANVLAVPLCGLTLVCNLASLLCAAWLPAAAILFNHLGWFLMLLIQRTSAWFAGLPGAYFFVGMPGWFGIALYYILLLTILTGWLFAGPRRKWKISGLALLCAFWGVGFWSNSRVARLTILPLESGHAVFAEEPAFHGAWLVDCGNENAVKSVLKPFLEAQGVNRLPNFILTHGEAGYIGGAEEIVKLFRPRRIFSSPIKFASPAYQALLRELSGAPSLQSPVARDDQLGPWTVIYPDAAKLLPRAEDNAMVLRAEFAGVRILLLSDLGHAGQNALVASGADLRADIVVAAAPPAGEPLEDALLEAVKPGVIVIAESAAPMARKNARSLDDRLVRFGVPVLHTRDSKAISLSVDPNGHWELRGMEGRGLNGVGRQPK